MYYVYILQSLKNEKLYFGFTENLQRRFTQHNEGKNISTRLGKPWKLICYEAYLSKKDAMAREKYFKTGWGRKYVKKTLVNYFEQKI